MTKDAKAARAIKEWRENPPRFVYDNFHISPDAWQIEALNALGGSTPNPRRRVAMKACTGPGKTALIAWACWHRLSCFGGRGEYPKGAALSGEGRDNLRDNLWAELSRWRERSDYLKRLFTWNKEQIRSVDHPEDWFLSARSYPKDADAEAIGRSMSGLHSPYPFMALDEIGAMPIGVGQKAEQIFTGGVIDGLIIGAGNPVSPDGLLYQICTALLLLWKVITVTGDPDDPMRSPRVPIDHARQMIATYGRDNPWVMATILGLFPPTGFNSLLGPDEVLAAMNRHHAKEAFEHAQKRLGIDVARFGDDRTIIFPRQGLAAFKPAEMRNARSNEIAARVMSAKAKFGSELEFVDDTGGWGSGVIDSLIQAGQSPIAVNFAGHAIDPRYLNKRAEMWFLMAEWIKRGGGLPNIPALAKELTAPTYTFSNGKFKLEDKDLIKARLKFSPDLADALALTFALPEMPASVTQLNPWGVKQQAKAKNDFDPFEKMSA